MRIRSLRLMEVFYESNMDRRWMNEHRISEEYEKGISNFLQYAQEQQSRLMVHICVLVFVILIKYVTTWTQCVIIYSSSV